MEVGKGFTTGVGCRLEAYPEGMSKTLFIGRDFQMNDYVHITAMESVKIGNNVLFASKIYISDCSHGSYSGDFNDSSPLEIPKDRKMFSKPVVIGDNVWLGEFVSVLPGVSIGKGSIVGANGVEDITLNNAATEATLKALLASSMGANKQTLDSLKELAKSAGLDPEIGGGIDNNIYPRPRMYSLNLSFDF
jgi:carbonic anhydrase/acetyltransferase-like protein (isoleucine patch superfamily)